MSDGPFGWTNSINLSPVPFAPGQMDRLRAAAKSVDQMGVALIDVSKGPSAAYAINFTKTGFAASLPKIAAMYAAYYLQDRLRSMALPLIGMNLAEIESHLRKDWRKELNAILPRRVNDFPDITWLFASAQNFEFSDKCKAHLSKMIQASDNFSAGTIIHKVGYDYLNAALIYGGLFNVKAASGLWIGNDFIKSTSAYNRDGKTAPGLKASVTASAEATANLLVNLALDTLISTDASRRMKNLMNNASSWVRDLIQTTTPSAKVYGKVGYVKNSNHDCAIVKYAQAHYVVVALFGKEELDPILIQLDAIAQDIFSFRKDLFVPDSGFLKTITYP